ncbi:hypothetical protein FACS1894191_4270 [Clostridia bacterium]|nr:hypothetical protein FACS1894191_4270 [Clostridia bacterium]
MVTITHSKAIKMALAYKGMTEKELASLMKNKTTQSALNQRLKTDKWKQEELEDIAHAIGAEYTFSFTFPDGYKI